MSAHSFFMAAGAGITVASGVGLPAFSGASAAAPGRQFARLRRGSRFVRRQPGLPDGNRPGQQRTAGNDHDGGPPGPQLRPVPFAQRLFHEAGGEHGQDHGRSHDGQALHQVGLLDAGACKGQDQDGPVPEVEGVGVVAEGNQWPGAQDPVHAEPAAALPGDDDCSGSQRGPQCDEAREGPVHRQDQAAGDHGRQPGPAQDHAQRLAGLQVRQGQRQQRPQRELPQPGPGIEVGVGLVGGRLVDGEHQGGDEDGRRRPQQRRSR